MSSSARRIALLCVIVTAFGSGAVLAQAGSTNVPNWTVPPYRASSPDGGLSTMTDISPGVAFVAMQPCRVFDTRDTPNGPYAGPRLIGNTPRTFDIDSGPCGPIPALVEAYSMNFGAILPDGANGFITIWPAGSAQPGVSSINPIQGTVVANAAIVPAGSGGAISVFPNTGVHLYGDINGYFTREANSGTGVQYFHWQSDNAGTFGAALIVNTNTGTGATWGLVARANSSGTGTAAVFGTSLATGGLAFGGRFKTDSTNFAAAGVKGVDGFGDPLPADDCGPCFNSGVLGASNGRIGVTGMTRASVVQGSGVMGVLLSAGTGTAAAATGYLGSEFGSDPGGGGPPWAVFGQGNIGASGIKPFLEPHPTDPSLVIQYIALEGPEAGTYFRGKGRFQRGTATIEVPEDFRMVTAPEGLSIQVTPIGEMATVAVVSIGLDRIVVKASRNVEFFYTVNGVRETFKDLKPIRRGGEFMPAKAESTMPAYLSEGQKRLLIRNGTYGPDGTVNMETAQHLGWDRIWEARLRPQPQPEPPTTP